jgi:hypothetical protein
MPRDEFWKAELRAAEIIAGQKISSLPVDPFAIAAAVDIVCDEISSGSPGVSGCLLKSADRFGIFYSSRFPNPAFLRFTIAHELGHYFLDGHPEYIFSAGRQRHQSDSGFESEDRYEREADTFAAALLMPKQLFMSSFAWKARGLRTVELLAEECGTSLTAAAIRYARLSENPVAVVVSIRDRIQFAFLSEPIKSIKGLTWIKRNTPVPLESATAKFNRDHSNVINANRIVSSSTMDIWFDGRADIELLEEVVGLGDYGRTLTVLSSESLPDPEDDEEGLEDDSENMLPSDRWRRPRDD